MEHLTSKEITSFYYLKNRLDGISSAVLRSYAILMFSQFVEMISLLDTDTERVNSLIEQIDYLSQFEPKED